MDPLLLEIEKKNEKWFAMQILCRGFFENLGCFLSLVQGLVIEDQCIWVFFFFQANGKKVTRKYKI